MSIDLLEQVSQPQHNGLEVVNAAGPLSSEQLRKIECLLAGRQLSVGRPDLSLRQPAAEGAA